LTQVNTRRRRVRTLNLWICSSSASWHRMSGRPWDRRRSSGSMPSEGPMPTPARLEELDRLERLRHNAFYRAVALFW